jgi:hypothetical protein
MDIPRIGLCYLGTESCGTSSYQPHYPCDQLPPRRCPNNKTVSNLSGKKDQKWFNHIHRPFRDFDGGCDYEAPFWTSSCHVESVVWVSERRDLLCALFFLLSSLTYAGYATAGSAHQKRAPRFFNKRYLLSLGFFALALLSKPMGKKLPFFVLSVISSILTILAQRAGGSMGMMVFVKTQCFSLRPEIIKKF